MPTVDFASVIGIRTSEKCAGVPTMASSVPYQRSRCSAELAATLVDDQMPITLDPSAAFRRARGSGLVRNTKHAVVAEESGQRKLSSPSKAERDLSEGGKTHPN